MTAQKYTTTAAKNRAYRARRKAAGMPSDRGTSTTKGKKTTLFSKASQGKLVVYDGEGVDTPHGHIYTMLCCLTPDDKLHTLYRNGERLHTVEILDFLHGVKLQYPNYLHAGFALGYDVTHWLHDLSLVQMKHATDADRPGELYEGYYISYIPRREFICKRNGTSTAIWDVFGFYQASLVSAIEAWHLAPFVDLDTIKAGKLERGTFTGYTLADLERYTRAELEATRLLIAALCSSVAELGLTLNRYDGAGALAASMYRKETIDREWMLKRQPVMVSRHNESELHDAIARAYFGGRIEAPQIGNYDGPVFDYDIRSAYPAALAVLPDLMYGHWSKVPENGVGRELELLYDTPTEIALCLVEWAFPQEMDNGFYPFPYRIGTAIYYPPEGLGYIWAPLVSTALHGADLWGEYGRHWRVKQIYRWTPARLAYPFIWAADQFAARQRLLLDKPAGWNGMQRVLKLGLNSLYGKLCQRAGTRHNDGNTLRPAYYNLAYAGLITATTQARLLDRALHNPQAIIAFATDGILSTDPLGIIAMPERNFGGWQLIVHDQVIMAYPGLYYLRDGDHWSEKSRGIRHAVDQNDITARLALIRRGWRTGQTAVMLPTRRFYGARLGTSSAAAFEQRGNFVDYDRAIDLRGGSGKRIARQSLPLAAASQLIRTSAVGWEFGLAQRLSDPANGHLDSDLAWFELEDALDTREALWA